MLSFLCCVDFRCDLSERDIRTLLDESTRTWSIDDAALERRGGIQAIINCTTEGDTILLETAERIQPDSRIVIPWRLTIESPVSEGEEGDANDQKVHLTCPSNEGLFLIG